MRAFVRYYYGSLSQARRILTYSLVPVKPQLPGQGNRAPLRAVGGYGTGVPQRGSICCSTHRSVSCRRVFAGVRAPPPDDAGCRAYISKAPPPDVPSNIVCPGFDSGQFLSDFASCRVYVTNAGFESVAEAIHLRKPTGHRPDSWPMGTAAQRIQHRTSWNRTAGGILFGGHVSRWHSGMKRHLLRRFAIGLRPDGAVWKPRCWNHDGEQEIRQSYGRVLRLRMPRCLTCPASTRKWRQSRIEHWWYRALHRLVEQRLVRYCGGDRCAPIVDAGCGTGGLIQNTGHSSSHRLFMRHA